MLAGAGLRDDARLAHAAGEQDLAEAIVDLVRAGVVELVALEVDLCAAAPAGRGRHFAQMLGQPLGEIERARPAGVVRVEMRRARPGRPGRSSPPRRPASRSRTSGISVSATKRPP